MHCLHLSFFMWSAKRKMLACRNFLQGIRFGEHSMTIRTSSGSSRSGFLRPIQAFHSVKSGILVIPEDFADSIMGVLGPSQERSMLLFLPGTYTVPATAPAPRRIASIKDYMPSLFKTVGAVLCLVFALCFAAPNAHADYIYTVSVGSEQFSFIEPTIASSGFVDSGLTDISDSTATAVQWNSAASAVCFGISFPGDACVGIANVGGGQSINFFPAGSFLAVGTYTDVEFGAVTVNIAQTGVPEPSSLLLLGSGVGALFGAVRRKLKV